MVGERLRHYRGVSDQSELGEAEQFARRERPFHCRLADAAVRDQLDDVAGRIVEVAGARLPVREVEDDLAAVPLRKKLGSLVGPLEKLGESVSGREQREVVERPPVGRTELELCGADLDRQSLAAPSDPHSEPCSVEVGQGRKRSGRRSQTDL